jgi:hypothetical protein
MESAMAKKKVFLVDWWPTLEQQRNALIRCSTQRRREMVVASSRRFSSKKLLPVPHQQRSSLTAAQATKWGNNKLNVIVEMNLIHQRFIKAEAPSSRNVLRADIVVILQSSSLSWIREAKKIKESIAWWPP